MNRSSKIIEALRGDPVAGEFIYIDNIADIILNNTGDIMSSDSEIGYWTSGERINMLIYSGLINSNDAPENKISLLSKLEALKFRSSDIELRSSENSPIKIEVNNPTKEKVYEVVKALMSIDKRIRFVDKYKISRI